MGKYSIKEYMKYPMTVVRPVAKKEAEKSVSAVYTRTVLSWRDIETERGRFDLGKVEEILQGHQNHLIYLQLDPPEFAGKETEVYQASFIHKMASFLEHQETIAGIYFDYTKKCPTVYEAFAESFSKKPLILDVFDQDSQDWFRVNRKDFGLLIHTGEEKLLDVGEALARGNLTAVWENKPIFVENTDSDHRFQKAEAARWHGRYSKYDSFLGPYYELRRVTYSRECSSGNHLPVRIWMVNQGTSPNYDEVSFKLKLKAKDTGEETALLLKENAPLKHIGDLVHNEILPLPKLTKGTYDVFLGLFKEDQESVPLNITNRSSEGYYHLGEIEVLAEGMRDYQNIWEDFYPEGYYPLEDPQTPEDENNEE